MPAQIVLRELTKLNMFERGIMLVNSVVLQFLGLIYNPRMNMYYSTNNTLVGQITRLVSSFPHPGRVKDTAATPVVGSYCSSGKPFKRYSCVFTTDCGERTVLKICW